MRRAVIVIGCSYGDEGKGLAADFAASREKGPCLNVLINGGAQRGHTVDLPDGRRHVFHHFGSASLRGAASCADGDFIVNPLLYAREREELERDFGMLPRLLISDRCRVSTPWDMMLGQIIEENRGRARHGSCGCGIQETRLRFMNTDWALRWGDLCGTGEAGYAAYCRRIVREYVPRRLAALGMTAGPEWREIMESEGLIRNSREDLLDMISLTERYADWEALAEGWPFLLFEAAQGLALDAENKADFPYLTPSRTTSLISARRIAALPGKTETEIIYVTRSYLTRHGAGPFPTECPKESINPDMTDRTNVPNPHQETLRYGFFDPEAVLGRVAADLAETRRVLPEAAASVLITHLNETGGKLACGLPLKSFVPHFDRAYFSASPWEVRGAENVPEGRLRPAFFFCLRGGPEKFFRFFSGNCNLFPLPWLLLV